MLNWSAFNLNSNTRVEYVSWENYSRQKSQVTIVTCHNSQHNFEMTHDFWYDSSLMTHDWLWLYLYSLVQASTLYTVQFAVYSISIAMNCINITNFYHHSLSFVNPFYFYILFVYLTISIHHWPKPGLKQSNPQLGKDNTSWRVLKTEHHMQLSQLLKGFGEPWCCWTCS